ncbi:MAG TPA: hypothetical protein ENH82_16460 [bacterium]|nr:hypothetical protein [bacterium]
MLRSINIFSKGSILPPILEMEGEIIEQENKALELAEEKIQKAKLEGEKLIENTTNELPVIEDDERNKLLESVGEKVGELNVAEGNELRELEKNVERNRKRALDLLMKKIIPHRESSYLD